MVALGAPKQLLHLMRIYPRDLGIQQTCCRSLGNLTLFQDLKDRMRQMEAIILVVRTMQLFPEEVDYQSKATLALANFVCKNGTGAHTHAQYRVSRSLLVY